MLELHSNARFARQRTQAGITGPAAGPRGLGKAAFWFHNGIYWFFIVPFVTPMSYGTGFAVYAAILFSRFVANTWINVRDFSWQQYDAYPFRIP